MPLVGPIFLHELTAIARRGRCFLLRECYASGMFFVVLWIYWNGASSFETGVVEPDVLAEFTLHFFLIFLGVQFVVAVLLTPLLVATAITDEKERRTLEFLLATDLRNREIVLGKLAARLGNLLLLLFVGLPILSLLQFLGGVEPNLLVAGFAFVLLTVVSLAALSILISVHSTRSRSAVLCTYLVAIAYQAGSFILYQWLLHGLPNDWGDPQLAERALLPTTPPVTLTTLANAQGAGNLFLLYSQIEEGLAAGLPLSTCLGAVLRKYA